MSRPKRGSSRGSTRNSRGDSRMTTGRGSRRNSREKYEAEKAAIGRVNMSLDFLYDKKEDKIVIPSGMRRFVAVDYIGRYPEVWTKVAGVTMEGRPQLIRELALHKRDGNKLFVELLDEPENPYDSNAKGVIVSAVSVNSKAILARGRIGYLPKELAKLLTEIRERYKMVYMPRIDKLQSNWNSAGEELRFPCSVSLVLTPEVEKELPRAPLHRVISLNMSKESIRDQFRPGRKK